MEKQKIIGIVDRLIELGEDKEELQYWLDVYDDLSDINRLRLAAMLEEELVSLKK